LNLDKIKQEKVFRAAKDTLGQILNPLALPEWLPELKDKAVLRADFVAGLTVALVLIPQSMAYAQLAGLPPYYGLYAALLPTMIAAFFGSSRQLATGPVAIVSLMTAAALEPLADVWHGGSRFWHHARCPAIQPKVTRYSIRRNHHDHPGLADRFRKAHQRESGSNRHPEH